MLMENLIHHKHSLKILFKSKHSLRRYRRKREWVFFEAHCMNESLLLVDKTPERDLSLSPVRVIMWL